MQYSSYYDHCIDFQLNNSRTTFRISLSFSRILFYFFGLPTDLYAAHLNTLVAIQLFSQFWHYLDQVQQKHFFSMNIFNCTIENENEIYAHGHNRYILSALLK